MILVRHGMPTILPGLPPSTWPLSPEGQKAAKVLAPKLKQYHPTAIVASVEVKALDTARAIAEVLSLDVSQDDGFAEQHNDSGVFQERLEIEALIARMFEHRKSLILGEETGE